MRTRENGDTRINLRLTQDNWKYVNEERWNRQMSITRFVNAIIEEYREQQNERRRHYEPYELRKDIDDAWERLMKKVSTKRDAESEQTCFDDLENEEEREIVTKTIRRYVRIVLTNGNETRTFKNGKQVCDYLRRNHDYFAKNMREGKPLYKRNKDGRRGEEWIVVEIEYEDDDENQGRRNT